MEYSLKSTRRMLGALTLALLGLSSLVAGGNTTCAGNLTDWYTNAVGETACETYQRLRQICNPQYQVPSFRPNTPGDQCDDELADCCCNSISFSLSMLCMNCQWDVIGGPPIGIDAGIGAYSLYRSPNRVQWCSPGTNQSLPNDIQIAVCNEKLRLDNFLYDLFWSDGAWFFVYTMDAANVDQHEYNNNTFTHCNSTTLTTTSSSSVATKTSSLVNPSATTSTPSAAALSSSSHSNTAAVVGGVVGGVGGAALLLAAAFFFCWKRRRQQPAAGPTMSVITPPTVFAPPDHSAQFSSPYSLQQSGRLSYMHSSSSLTRLASEAGVSQRSSDIVRSPLWNKPIGPTQTLLPPAYNLQWDPSRSQPQFQPQLQPQSQSLRQSLG